jgi:hydrogenase-1 operon protein HyaF
VKPFPLPVVEFASPPRSAEDPFDFPPMPKAEPLARPLPPEDATFEERATAADVLEQVLEAMERHEPGSADPPRFSLRALAPGALRALNESLGQGEVSATVANGHAPAWCVQESAFAGLWRVQRDDGCGQLVEDLIEAGDMPVIVKQAAVGLAAVLPDPAQLPEGVMNAPALVSEIRHHATAWKPGRRAHVINLSLLPLNAADHQALAALLGEGPITILSRGFGNCRIGSTRARAVWRVQYFNSMSTLILDTIEVVDIPEAARAAAEDYRESRERLRDLLNWLRED